MAYFDATQNTNDPGERRAVILKNGVLVLHGDDLLRVVGRHRTKQTPADRCMVEVDAESSTLTLRRATDAERTGSTHNPPIKWRDDGAVARIGIAHILGLLADAWKPDQNIPIDVSEKAITITIS